MGDKISGFLFVGRDHATPLTELCARVNLSERAVQKEILESRLNGELIISGDEGYYFPSDLDELRDYVIRRKASIKTAAAALQPFIKALREG
jgi:hypothetical protein